VTADTPESNDLHAEYLAAMDELEAAQTRVTDACTALAYSADPGGPTERKLLEAMAARKKVAARVGMLVLQWKITGGLIALTKRPPALVVLVTDGDAEESGELDLDMLFEDDAEVPPGVSGPPMGDIKAVIEEITERQPPTVMSLEDLERRFRGEDEQWKTVLESIMDSRSSTVRSRGCPV